VEDAEFCHICGLGIRPWPEAALFRRSREILAESGKIIERLAENLSKSDVEAVVRLDVRCTHCRKWRDYRKMKRVKGDRWVCFDHVDCGIEYEARNIVDALAGMGFDRNMVEDWMDMPIRVFDGLTPRQMLNDGREDAVRTLIAETQSGFAF